MSLPLLSRKIFASARSAAVNSLRAMSTIPVPKTKATTYASRLQTGRALALDVWSVFNQLNLPADCINLGQGYMNFAPPQWVKDAASDALGTVAANHYSHPRGRTRLREAIKNYYDPLFDRSLDVNTEIIVSSGANEGQYSVFTAFLNPGDEVIFFEPFFDQYLPSVTFNGGVPIYVPLHPPAADLEKPTSNDWTIDFNELRNAITPRTKMIIVNTPHNPVGKVFSRQELEGIAALAEEFDLQVMSDEVYEALVFDGKEHVRFATLPRMWERTVTVGSAGKMFAATGWRVGWLIGPESIIGPSLAAQTRIVFCTNSPLQEAAASGLEEAKQRKYFEQEVTDYSERRQILVDAFDKLGAKYTLPEGTYFILLDISEFQLPEDYPYPDTVKGRGRDFKFGWVMAQEIGVSAIPVSEFYCEEHCSIGQNFIRFAFCKDLDTLRKAAVRLQNLSRYMKK